SALNRAPCFQLCRAKLGFFLRMPADARRIENDLRAAKRGESRTFRIPLVPADLNADARVFRIEIRKTEIARREIKLFVVKGVVWNVHLAVFAQITSVSVDYSAAVVINARGAAFEKGSNDDNFLFFGDVGEPFSRRAGDRLSKIEKSG